MEVLVVDHPLAAERLTRLRNQDTSPIAFRRVLEELSEFLVYEATRDIAGVDVTIQTPLQATSGIEITHPPLIVPVLRAALGMLDAALKLLPMAEVGFLGVRRNEETLQPEEYLQTVPSELNGGDVIILDPMLATGGSASAALEALERWGVPRLKLCSVIAAPEGIAELESRFESLQIYVCSVDRCLNQHKFILPGLGDAGDRIFNT